MRSSLVVRRRLARPRGYAHAVSRTALAELQAWYQSQCDGDWEHQYGISIESLDHPGWSLRVDLQGTDLAERMLEPLEERRTADDWLYSAARDGQFRAAGGPRNLDEMIDVFLRFAREEL